MDLETEALYGLHGKRRDRTNLLAQRLPERLRLEDVSADYNDMIYAGITEADRKTPQAHSFASGFLKCRAVADSLEEAADRR